MLRTFGVVYGWVLMASAPDDSVSRNGLIPLAVQ